MGEAGEAQNIAHQAKKMKVEAMRTFRDRFHLPISDARSSRRSRSTGRPKTAPEMNYLRERVAQLGAAFRSGGANRRRSPFPNSAAFDAQLKGTGEREISTTMAFVRILTTLVRDKTLGPRIVPIVADESRTFGMEGHVPPARHLLVGRTALPSARRRAADVVPRGQARTDPAGRHQRSRRDVVVDRGGHVVLERTICR